MYLRNRTLAKCRASGQRTRRTTRGEPCARKWGIVSNGQLVIRCYHLPDSRFGLRRVPALFGSLQAATHGHSLY